jgi:hypothetical protein
MAPQNFREIDELLQAGTILEPGEPEYARAVQRGLGKQAPFTSDKNSVADALLIEIYASQVSEAGGSDVYAFVTSNYRDFSVPNGDRRQPHPDLAGLFDGTRSRYAYEVDGLHQVLLEQFGDEYLEEQDGLGLLVVDGYADLDPDGRPGLGAHAHAEFGIPVIGVAKSRFRTATHAVPVARGSSVRPLFVTAAGCPAPTRRIWSGAWLPTDTGCPTPCAAQTPSRGRAQPSPP